MQRRSSPLVLVRARGEGLGYNKGAFSYRGTGRQGDHVSELEERGADCQNGHAKIVALMALSAGLYWSWWDAFHEICRFLVIGAPLPEPRLFLGLGGSYLQCVMKPIGVAAGSIAILMLASRWNRSGKSIGGVLRDLGHWKALVFRGLVVLQVVVWAVFCIAINEGWWFEAGILYGVASFFTAPVIMCWILLLRRMPIPSVCWAIIGAFCCYGVGSNLVYSLLLQDAPIVIVFALYLFLLVAAYGLFSSVWHRLRQIALAEEGGGWRLPPWPLATHVVVYGCVFGILHIIEGIVITGPYSISIGVFLGCLIAMAIFAMLFARKASSREIWSKMRSTVFPLVIIGYLLIPLAENSDWALAFTEAASHLYLAILFLGCVSLMNRTSISAPAIVAWALLLYSLGEAAGVTVAGLLKSELQVTPDSYFALLVVIVALLTAATFWVASDEQVRKLWGLRREIEPKRYHDLLAKIRVERFTEQYGLTPREAEVLRMVTQGRRAPEMVEAMGVSMDTVRTHLKHLYTKLDAHSYAEVVAMAEAMEVPDSALSELLVRER